MIQHRRVCATMPHHFELAATSEQYRARRRRIETFTRTARPAPRTQVLTIPVVVHVIFHEDADNLGMAQIQSQIDVLNADFRFRNDDRRTIPSPFQPHAGDTLIEFALATRDPQGLPTDGVIRLRTQARAFPYDGASDATTRLDAAIKFAPTGLPAWPRDDYLNLWVVPLGDGLLGYAQFPGGAADTDGVVIRSTAFGKVGNVMDHYNLGRTCVHEVGHWLNLLHIWGDDGNGCEHSDNIADTPNQGGPNEGMPGFPHPSCGNGPDGDMYMNYMDYVDDAAMVMFSRGQIDRINATLSGPRASLSVSSGLLPLDAGVGTRAPRPAMATLVSAFAAPRLQKAFDGVDWA